MPAVVEAPELRPTHRTAAGSVRRRTLEVEAVGGVVGRATTREPTLEDASVALVSEEPPAP